MKFKVLYPKDEGEFIRDETELVDLFTEDWRASSNCAIAAGKLAIGQTVKVCGLQITRTE